MIKSIKYKGVVYKYNDDVSFNKWKDFIFCDWTTFQRIDFVLKNVVVDVDLSTIDSILATDVARKVIDVLGLNEQGMKKTRKSMGKAVRGIRVKDYSVRAVQFEIMHDMNGSVRLDDFEKMSIFDFLFLQRYVDELHKQEQEAMDASIAQVKGMKR